ncbi:hypothetical protein [Oscillatoria sp. HE19RPO]|uniref:hypothetical protein n=1 Tax=Oscillatoria sp. HE19RPO TaxID=2954806 RepID=UPI0020C2A30D|nr:hypothetical protein [Oscillatoria sp. HE19RPO]
MVIGHWSLVIGHWSLGDGEAVRSNDFSRSLVLVRSNDFSRSLQFVVTTSVVLFSS